MMIEYHVWDEWPAGDPGWLKAIVSSLYRRRPRPTTMLPLGCAVQELLHWIEFASGEDAWIKKSNRRSLIDDYHQSITGLGPSLTEFLRVSLGELSAAFSDLDKSKKDDQGKLILAQPPGARIHPSWRRVKTASRMVLTELVTDGAVEASWTDLVSISQLAEPKRYDHRWVANVLFEQIQLRECDADAVFRAIVDMLAYGRSVTDSPTAHNCLPVADRLDAAKAIALAPPPMAEVVIWLGYAGARVDHVVAGNVIFMDAHWFGPNADADWTDFVGKAELAELRRRSLFSVAEQVDERSDVDILARVDLGITSTARAIERAEVMVDALLSLSVHWSGGARPFRTQAALFRDGHLGEQRIGHPPHERFTGDQYGANITGTAIAEFTPELGAALAKRDLPRYLAAAVELQTAADMPFSRENMFRGTIDAEIHAAIPLEDRVVQHVAAHACLSPVELFERLIPRWTHARWEADVQNATLLCLLGSGPNRARIDQLRGQLYMSNAAKPWLVFVADNAKELGNLCRVESERNWVNRILRSVSEPIEYLNLMKEYEAEATIIRSRRARVRNSLAHGNPASPEVVKTVTDISGFSSRCALRLGLESFITGDSVGVILDREIAELKPVREGLSVADYWRCKSSASTPAQTAGWEYHTTQSAARDG